MGYKYSFFRTTIFKVIFCFYLNIFSIQLFFGEIFGQSLISDSLWFEKNVIQSKKNDKKFKKTPLSPKDLFFPNFIELDREKKLFSENVFGFSSSKIEEKNPIYKTESVYKDGKLSESMLIRLFPWFSNSNLSKLADKENFDWNSAEKEFADKEFEGIFLWAPYIQKLLIKNPEKARLNFLEIEKKLSVDDRTLLKVQLFYFFKEWYKAEKLANAFLRENPESLNIPLIFYYLNKSLHAQKKNLNHDRLFIELAMQSLKPKLLSDLLQILSNDKFNQGEIYNSLKYRVEELKNKETSKFSDKKFILKLLRELRALEDLKRLSESFPYLTWLQEQILSFQISILFEKKRFKEAIALVEVKLDFAKSNYDSLKIEFLNEIHDSLSKYARINPRKIGVVLPLSSSSPKIARLAQETLNGLWVALHANEIITSKSKKINKQEIQKVSKSKKDESSQKSNRPWELVVRDSRLSEEVTKNVIHELVEKEHVIAIIGPLARKTSEAAAGEAEKLRVPLISLSLTDSIPKLGDYIFRNNKSWKQEVTELLDYAISELNARRFVILFAKTREGRQKMKYFWDEALNKDCEIVAVGGFEDEGQKSLVNEFDTFTGKNLFMNLEDQNILKELKEKEDPIHNFDAVFVAVGSGGVKNLRLIFPYSSVYRMEKTTFLGDSGWNDLAIQFAPGLRGVVNPIFVDSFSLASKTLEMEKLLNLHERILYKHQNYLGPTDYTAYAYDTLMILLKLLSNKSIQSHRELKESLLKMQPFSGVTGNLTFDKSGEIRRKLKFLTIRRGKIQPLF